MPKGVAKDFLRILEEDRRAARLRLIVFSVLAALLLAPAWYLADDAGTAWVGLAVHAVGLLAGGGLGFLWAQRHVRGVEASMRGHWRDWMAYSVGGDSVPDLHRRVRGRSGRGRVYLLAAVLLAAWALETLMLAAAFMDGVTAAWSWAAIAVNGAVVGFLVAYAVRMLVWTRAFRSSLDDMVAEGELGLWGVV